MTSMARGRSWGEQTKLGATHRVASLAVSRLARDALLTTGEGAELLRAEAHTTRISRPLRLTCASYHARAGCTNYYCTVA